MNTPTSTQNKTTAVLEHLDPTQLIVDAYVRADMYLDTEFTASIDPVCRPEERLLAVWIVRQQKWERKGLLRFGRRQRLDAV